MKSRAQRYRYVRHVVSGTRPSPWSPLSLGSSLAGWWETYDASKLWQDSARTTPVAADNDPIGAIDDLSGGGRHATQATDGDREAYKTAILNGLSSARSDGTKFLRVPDDAALSPTTSFTFAIVLKTATIGSADNYLASKFDFNVGAAWGIVFGDTVGATRVFIATGASDLSTYGDAPLLADNTAYMLVVIYDGSLTGNANRLKVRVNGVAQTLSFLGTIPSTIADVAADLCLGCILVNSAEYGNFVGDIFAALFAGRAITQQEATALEEYWAARYGSVVLS